MPTYYNSGAPGTWPDPTDASQSHVTATGSPTARSLAARAADVVNVKDFGAVGDGVTDDTVAMQAAFTRAYSTVGANSRFGTTISVPPGSYRVSSTLTLAPAGQMTEIRLIGAAIDSTEIAWYGGNSTCISLAGRTRGLRIENLRLENKGAVGTSVGIQFGGDVVGTNHSGVVMRQVRIYGFNEGLNLGDASAHGVSEFLGEHIYLDANTTGVTVRDTQSTNLWFHGLGLSYNTIGMKVVNASSLHVIGGSASANAEDFALHGLADGSIDKYRSENAGRFMTIGPASPGGQTNGTFSVRDCVVNQTANADKRAVLLNWGAQYVFENNRFLDGHLYLATGASARTALHLRGNTIPDTTFIENGDVASAFTLVYSFGNKSDATTFYPDRVYYERDAATTKDYWSRSTTNTESDVVMTSVAYMEGGEIAGPSAPAASRGRLYFKDNGNGKTQMAVRFPAGAVRVLTTEAPSALSTDRGDTSQTLTVGTDAPTQRWATELTANRTVTLATAGAANGDTFRIVRTGLGAFTLDVGGLKTIASATAAFVDVAFDGTGWFLTGFGAL